MKHGWVDRVILIATREQIEPRPGEPPICAQDAEQLGRQHYVAILGALAVAHQNDAASAVDVLDTQPGDLRSPQPGRIGGGQGGARLLRLDTASRN